MKEFSSAERAGSGVTLLEVLVVIAVVGTLIALLLPVLSSAKTKASRATCISNQRQIATALLLYVQNDPEERFPSTNLMAIPQNSPAALTNAIMWSYRFFISEYLGAEKRVFHCPADTFVVYGNTDPDSSDEWLVRRFSYFGRFGSSYCFNGWNFPSNTPPPFSGLAGVSLHDLSRPERTVLTCDRPVYDEFSWHEPGIQKHHRPALNVMSFVDGHVEYLKTEQPLFATNGLVTAPPPGFEYQWDP